MTLLDRLAAEVLVLDGAMGTRLQAHGLALGAAPDLWVLERPELVEAVHREYVDAGAQVVFTNTFGANRPRLRAHAAAFRSDGQTGGATWPGRLSIAGTILGTVNIQAKRAPTTVTQITAP